MIIPFHFIICTEKHRKPTETTFRLSDFEFLKDFLIKKKIWDSLLESMNLITEPKFMRSAHRAYLISMWCNQRFEGPPVWWGAGVVWLYQFTWSRILWKGSHGRSRFLFLYFKDRFVWFCCMKMHCWPYKMDKKPKNFRLAAGYFLTASCIDKMDKKPKKKNRLAAGYFLIVSDFALI